jgi:hypothetical protein
MSRALAQFNTTLIICAAQLVLSLQGIRRSELLDRARRLSLTLCLQLSKRAFYVLQEYRRVATIDFTIPLLTRLRSTDATANHWDIRIQLDGGPVSFCIPKGIFDFEQGPERRYVVWQPVHPIADCLVEGGSVGDKEVDDLGLYTVSFAL